MEDNHTPMEVGGLYVKKDANGKDTSHFTLMSSGRASLHGAGFLFDSEQGWQEVLANEASLDQWRLVAPGPAKVLDHIEALEKRVAALEKRLESTSRSPSRASGTSGKD